MAEMIWLDTTVQGQPAISLPLDWTPGLLDETP